MCDELIIAWQNPKTRSWVPVGKLRFRKERYVFSYTQGAKNEKDFIPFGAMKEIGKKYESEELFPLFQNRLLQRSRPEYANYLKWLSLSEEAATPLEELARTGGIRATDSLQLFPVPQKNGNDYTALFFSHGVSHLPQNYIERVDRLNQGAKLYLMRDIQNNCDSFALALRTEAPVEIVGYCPRFFVRDFGKLIDINGANNLEVTVIKVNPDSPVQLKLLCKLTTTWPEGFLPFDENDFKDVA